MKTPICWKERCDDGVKREVRVEVAQGSIKWQFKRADEGDWSRDQEPDLDDWDSLEEVLERRAARGRSVNMLIIVRKARAFLGHPGAEQPPPGA